MSGFIKLNRKLFNHPMWLESRTYSRAEAWLDLMQMARFEDGKQLINGCFIEVKRGSIVASNRYLQERWKWSNTKISAFLKRLVTDKMLLINNDSKNTVLTLCNYALYNDADDAKNDKETTVKRQRNDKETTNIRRERKKRTKEKDLPPTPLKGEEVNFESPGLNSSSESQEPITPPSDKNPKEEKVPPKEEKKIEYAESVKMSEVEFNKLVANHGDDGVRRLIEILSDYKVCHGKQYKSDYRAILLWVVEKYQKERRDDEQRNDNRGAGATPPLTREQREAEFAKHIAERLSDENTGQVRNEGSILSLI